MTRERNQSEVSAEGPLDRRLRNLPRFAAPASLREKLLSDIPDMGFCSPVVGPGSYFRRRWAWAAAAVSVFALAIFMNYGPSILPNGLITEANIASANNNVVDHNSTRIVDINQANLLNR